MMWAQVSRPVILDPLVIIYEVGKIKAKKHQQISTFLVIHLSEAKNIEIQQMIKFMNW